MRWLFGQFSIAAEAEWVWNGKTMNTMTFEFAFEDIYETVVESVGVTVS